MGGFSFDRLYRSYPWKEDPENFVELTEEQKQKKREEQFMESLPSYMKWDKDIQNVLLGEEGSPSRDIAGAVHKGMELSQEGLNKLTSGIAGVPEQPAEKTWRGAFAGSETVPGSVIPRTGEPAEYGGLTDEPSEDVTIPRVFGDVAVKGLQMAADPSQLALMAGGPLGMALAPVMVPEMAQAGGEQFGTGMAEATMERDPEEAYSLMATGAIDIGMAGLGAKHPIEAAGKYFKGGVLDVPMGGEEGSIGLNIQRYKVGDKLPNGKYVHEVDSRGIATVVGKNPPIPDIPTPRAIPSEPLTAAESGRIDIPESVPGAVEEALAPKPTPEIEAPPIAVEPEALSAEPIPEPIEAPAMEAEIIQEPPIEAPPTVKAAPSPSMEPPDIAMRTQELIAEGHEPGRAARIARAEFAESMDEITAAMDQLTPEDVDSLMAAEVAGEGAIPTPPEALKGTTKITKPPPEIPLAEEGIPSAGEEAPVRTFKVKLSNGETYSTKARSVEEAVTKTNEQLEEYGSQVRATEALYTPSRLERLIETPSPSRESEMLKASRDMERARVAEELKAGRISQQEAVAANKAIDLEEQRSLKSAVETGKEAEKISRAQAVEMARLETQGRRAQEQQAKQQKRKEERIAKATTPFEVTLDNGETVTIRGKDIESVTAHVESKGGKVSKIIPKPSPLDKALAAGEPVATTPEGALREAVTVNDTFRQAWGKLSPLERTKEIYNIFKALRGSGEIGFMLRQGKITTLDMLFRNPKALYETLKTMKNQTFSEAEFQQIQESYEKSPEIKKLTDIFGLDLAGVGGRPGEEFFHKASLAEKLPIVGRKWIRPSDRAQTAFLNASRVYKMNQIVDRMTKAGLDPVKDLQAFKDAAKVVNIISRRGDFGKAQPVINALNYAMWSARMKGSAFQLFNEYLKGTTGVGFGKDLHPIARKELTRGMNQVIGFNAAILGAAAAFTGADVETDPTHTDFGKLKVGTNLGGGITFNPWMDLQPIVRNVARSVTGRRVTRTGRESQTGAGREAGEWLASGAAPGISTPFEIMAGRTLNGYERNRAAAALEGLTPMFQYELVNSFIENGLTPEQAWMIPAFAGEGVDVTPAPKVSGGGGDWAETSTRRRKGKRSEVAW